MNNKCPENCTCRKHKPSPLKGRSHVEIHGKEEAERLRKLNSERTTQRNLGRKYITTKPLIDISTNTTGVYLMINIANGKLYVGSSQWAKERVLGQLSKLRNGGGNRLMRADFLLYGESAFRAVLLEPVDKSELKKREQFWMDCIKPEYNISPTSTSNLGVVMLPEFNKKLSEILTGLPHKKGYKYPPERLAAIKLARKINNAGC